MLQRNDAERPAVLSADLGGGRVRLGWRRPSGPGVCAGHRELPPIATPSPLPNTINDAQCRRRVCSARSGSRWSASPPTSSGGARVQGARSATSLITAGNRGHRGGLLCPVTASRGRVNGCPIFLIPVDARLARDYDVEDEAGSALDRIVVGRFQTGASAAADPAGCLPGQSVRRPAAALGSRPAAAPKGGLGKIDGRQRRTPSSPTPPRKARYLTTAPARIRGRSPPRARQALSRSPVSTSGLRSARRGATRCLRTTAGPAGAVHLRLRSAARSFRWCPSPVAKAARSDGEPRPGRARPSVARSPRPAPFVIKPPAHPAGRPPSPGRRSCRRPVCRPRPPAARRPGRTEPEYASRDSRLRSRGKRIRYRPAGRERAASWQRTCAQCPPPMRSRALRTWSSAGTRLKPQGPAPVFESIATDRWPPARPSRWSLHLPRLPPAATTPACPPRLARRSRKA